MKPAPSAGWAAAWTANDHDRQSLTDWYDTHIPADIYNPMAYASLGADGWAAVGRKLMACTTDAFSALESQLGYTAYFAGLEAQALGDARAADWHGEAADRYRQTLGKLPAHLEQVSDAYNRALAALGSFADTSVGLKQQYVVFQQDMTALERQWDTALHETYLTEDVGGGAIRQLQRALTEKLADGQRILRNASYAFDDLEKVIDSLDPNPPGAVILAKGALHGLDRAYHDILNTPSAWMQFAEHPDVSTGQNLVTDLSVDAAAVVLAAGIATGVTEAVGGLVLTESAEESVIAVSSDVAAQAGAAGLDLGAINVGLDLAQGKTGAAAISAVTLGFGFHGALEGDDLSEALNDVTLVDRYQAELAAADGNTATALKALGRDAPKLRGLVHDYKSPAAVEAWLSDAKSQLSHARIKAGLVTGPAKFVGGKAASGAAQAAEPKKPPAFPSPSGG